MSKRAPLFAWSASAFFQKVLIVQNCSFFKMVQGPFYLLRNVVDQHIPLAFNSFSPSSTRASRALAHPRAGPMASSSSCTLSKRCPCALSFCWFENSIFFSELFILGIKKGVKFFSLPFIPLRSEILLGETSYCVMGMELFRGFPSLLSFIIRGRRVIYRSPLQNTHGVLCLWVCGMRTISRPHCRLMVLGGMYDACEPSPRPWPGDDDPNHLEREKRFT